MSRLMPALSDGRSFTTYLSSGLLEEGLQRQLRIVNENQYRAYLQSNPGKIAETLRRLSMGGMAPRPAAAGARR